MKAYEIRLKTVNALGKVYDDCVVSMEEREEILKRLSGLVLTAQNAAAEKRQKKEYKI